MPPWTLETLPNETFGWTILLQALSSRLGTLLQTHFWNWRSPLEAHFRHCFWYRTPLSYKSTQWQQSLVYACCVGIFASFHGGLGLWFKFDLNFVCRPFNRYAPCYTLIGCSWKFSLALIFYELRLRLGCWCLWCYLVCCRPRSWRSGLEQSEFAFPVHGKGSLTVALSRLSTQSKWILLTYKVLVLELVVKFELKKVVALEKQVYVDEIVNKNYCLDVSSEWHWYLFIQLNL